MKAWRVCDVQSDRCLIVFCLNRTAAKYLGFKLLRVLRRGVQLSDVEISSAHFLYSADSGTSRAAEEPS